MIVANKVLTVEWVIHVKSCRFNNLLRITFWQLWLTSCIFLFGRHHQTILPNPLASASFSRY
jgi:hypothetical protein